MIGLFKHKLSFKASEKHPAVVRLKNTKLKFILQGTSQLFCILSLHSSILASIKAYISLLKGKIYSLPVKPLLIPHYLFFIVQLAPYPRENKFITSATCLFSTSSGSRNPKLAIKYWSCPWQRRAFDSASGPAENNF